MNFKICHTYVGFKLSCIVGIKLSLIAMIRIVNVVSFLHLNIMKSFSCYIFNCFHIWNTFALLGKIIVVVTNGAFLLIVVVTIMRGMMQIGAFLVTTTKRNAKIILYQELLIELMIKLHTFTWYYIHVQLFCK